MTVSAKSSIVALTLFLTACSWQPLRVFQAKVPEPLAKAPAQIEAERRGADLIARKIEQPEELKPVAVALAASLGAPAEPIEAATAAELPKVAATATAELQAGMVKMQRQIEQLNRILAKYQGKEIEGTGFSLLGPGATVIIVGLIVLAVAFPPVLTLLVFAYRRLKATAGIVVNQLEDAANAPETREAVAIIKAKVRQRMAESPVNTQALKSVVLDLKKQA